MTCPSCNHPFESGDTFCGQCGAKLPRQQADDTSFVPLPTGPMPTRRRKSQPKPGKRSRFRPLRIFGILTIVTVLALGSFSWYAYRSFYDVNTLSEIPASVQFASDSDSTPTLIDTGPAMLAMKWPNLDEQLAFSTSGLLGTHYGTTGHATPPANVQAARQSNPVASTEANDSTKTTGTTILLMGVDAGDSEQIDVGVRPDSLSVLHLDPQSGSCRILGIPRDSRVELPGYGLSKVNHALAVGGVPYQMLVVQQFLGIKIDHYGLVDFEGLVGVVDAVGGITVNNDAAFTVGNDYFAEGDIELNGEQALRFSRYRGGPDGDFGRIDRQQLVIRALLSELGGVDAVRAVPSLMGAAEGHFKTDLSAVQLISLANQYRSSCTSGTLETRSMTGAIESHPDPLFDANLSFVILSPQEIEAGLNWLFNGEDDPAG